jgi:hypothetical protein
MSKLLIPPLNIHTDTTSNLAPGGWAEFQDWDCTLRSEDGSTKGTSIEQYYNVIIAAYTDAGYEIGPGPLLEGWLREAGFENIHVEKFLIPMGGWPKNEHQVSMRRFN